MPTQNLNHNTTTSPVLPVHTLSGVDDAAAHEERHQPDFPLATDRPCYADPAFVVDAMLLSERAKDALRDCKGETEEERTAWRRAVSFGERVRLLRVQWLQEQASAAAKSGGMTIVDEVTGAPVTEVETTPATAVADNTRYVNDATVHGVIPDSILAMDISYAWNMKDNAFKGTWKTVVTDLRGFFSTLSVHAEGAKKGICFLQGDLIGGDRDASAVTQQYLLVMDFDSGDPLETIHEKIQELGLLALVHTTHSHMTSVTEIKRDVLLKFIGDDAAEITEDDAVRYLIEKKGYNPNILQNTTIGEAIFTHEGVKVPISHAPMTKARAVFVLKEPFSFAKGGTQKARATEWKERYAGLARKLGLTIDKACTDVPRLFFFPRHRKGGAFQIDVFAGDLLDLDTIDRVPLRELDAPTNAFTRLGNKILGNGGNGNLPAIETPGLLQFLKKYEDRFEFEDFLLAVDPDGDRGPRSSGSGRTHRCPNDDEHGNAGNLDDKGFFCVNSSESDTEKYVAFCSHNSCQGISRARFVDLACIAANQTVKDLVQFVPLLVGEELNEDGEIVEEGMLPFANIEEARKAAESLTPKSSAADKQAVVNRLVASELSALENEEVEQAIQAHTGMKPALLKKAKKEAFTRVEDPSRGLPPATVEAFEKFNERYAYLNEGSGRMIRFEDDGTFTLKQVKATEQEFEHERVVFGGEEKALLPSWRKWPGKRSYSGMKFAPGKTQEEIASYFNTYRGLGVVPKAGDWSLMQHHIRHVLADDDPEIERFIIGTMSYILQHIGQERKKLTTSLVIRGAHGSGKSYPFECFGHIFGRHYSSLSKPDHVLSRFNAHLGESLFVILEEAVFARNPANAGPLKDLVTGATMVLERKGIDATRVPNYCHFVVISNADDPVPFPSTERRYFPIKARDDYSESSDPVQKTKNVAYFTPLRRQMEDEGGIEAMAWDLMNWTPPDGDWSFLRMPPETNEKERMIGLQLSPVERFIVEFVHGGGAEYQDKDTRSMIPIELNDDAETDVTAGEIAMAFRWWLESQPAQDRARANSSPAAVGKKLSEMLPCVKSKATGHKKAVERVFPPQPEVVEALKGHSNRGYAGLLRELDTSDEATVGDGGAE